MDVNSLHKLVFMIDSLRKEQLLLENVDPNNAAIYKLYPQARKPDLSKLKLPKGTSCPESYAKFINLFNGWRGFWPDWSLIGVPRPYNRDMYSDIKMNLDLIPEVIDKKTLAELPNIEGSDQTRIFLPNHFIFGTDINGSFLVFDRNRLDKDGEPQVAWVHFLQFVDRRWENFWALLHDAFADIQADVKALQKSNR